MGQLCYMAKSKPYSLCTPAFDPLSGGIRVMYGLYGWLLAKGQIVHLNAKYEDRNFIGIYPEIYHGNPTGANIVARYILNKPGVMASHGTPGPTVYEKTDRIFVFSKIFDTFGVDDDHLMFLPILNLHLFKDRGRVRNKKCVFFGKYSKASKMSVHFAHPNDCINLDHILLDANSDQGKLADFLNDCQVMYGYDSVSAMYEVARLCGCRVVIIPDGSYTKKEFGQYEPGMNGISWDVKEDVPLDGVKFRNHYISMVKLFDRKLDKFISLTQA